MTEHLSDQDLNATVLAAVDALTRAEAESLAGAHSQQAQQIADDYWANWRAARSPSDRDALSTAMSAIHKNVHGRAVTVDGSEILIPGENDYFEGGVNLAEPWWTALQALSNAHAKEAFTETEFAALVAPWRVTYGKDPR